MKCTRLWIAHSDSVYAQRFMEYVNLNRNPLFRAQMCRDRQQLEDVLREKQADLLLLDPQWYESCGELTGEECIVLLSDGRLPGELGDFPAVYRYQSAERILCDLMRHYAEKHQAEEEYVTGISRDNQVIGVYSPDGKQNLIFALTLGHILAEHQNILYLNLEECSGFSELFGSGSWNLSDLIYFLRQNKSNFFYRLTSMIRKMDRLQYVSPCEHYVDFCQISVEEWQQLIQLLRTQSSYESVILELGNATGHELDLLRQCDTIYVPMQGDLLSQAQIRQWQAHIRLLDGKDVLEKLRLLELSETELRMEREEDLSLFLHGKLGQQIRFLLQEQENT